MTPLMRDLQTLLTRELRSFARELEMCPDEETIWRTAPGVTNTIGNLAAHVSGNLQHFIGAVLGGSGYVRDRDFEFSRRSGTRAELLREIDTTIAMVAKYLPAIDADTLARPYPQPVGGVQPRTDLFLMHLAVHLAHHLGQAGYLRRILTGDSTSSGPVGLAPLAD